MSEILKPCPFCGSPAYSYHDNCIDFAGVKCDLGGCVCADILITENNWNTRPIEDALNARIAELEAAQRWIPVSERLPEVNEDVFTVVYDTNDGSTSVSALKHHGDGVWFIWDKGYYVVTHWMPMPKLPEAQE